MALTIFPLSRWENVLRDTAEFQQAEAWSASSPVWPGDTCSAPGRHPCPRLPPWTVRGLLGAHGGHSACVWWVGDPMNEWRTEDLPSHEEGPPERVTVKGSPSSLKSSSSNSSCRESATHGKPTQEAPPSPAESEERRAAAPTAPGGAELQGGGDSAGKFWEHMTACLGFGEEREPFCGAAVLTWPWWWNISPASILAGPWL